MLAIGDGGLDVAVAMAGGAFYLAYLKVVRVNLKGKLKTWSTAKDVILELLKKLTTKRNVGTVIEYSGPGVSTLSVPERATITNMGAELGATTSVFPSDEITRTFFCTQSRENDWTEFIADKDAQYDRTIDLDLSAVEPNIALPHSPDNVRKIKEMENIRVDQVLIGSYTNSSYKDFDDDSNSLKG